MIKKILLAIIFLSIFSNCTANNKNNPGFQPDFSPHSSIVISSEKYGAIKGTIQTEETTDRVGLVLYLGDIITDSNGMFGGFLDPETSPIAIFDSTTGDFVFNDVNPGEYSLIIHEVVLGGQALVDETGNVVIISVEQGKITDLGKVQFNGF